MIPPLLAILLWIFVSLTFFATLTPLRAFLLTYVIGMLFLPVETGNVGTYVATFVITQSLRIDKIAACHIGAILGTLIFAPHVIRRFRFHWVDGVLVAIGCGVFLSSMTNGRTRDAFSDTVEFIRIYVPVIVLARMYIVTVGDLHQAMRAIIGGAFVYAFICVVEWRLSPQLHRIAYGYFQHSFDEFIRYDHFRPIGFLRHAIELSFFMGTSTALTGWLWFKKLFKPLWGFVPAWAVFSALLVGLACTLTFSGYAAFLICCTMFVLLQTTRIRWLLCILPLVAAVWMVGRYTDTFNAAFLLQITNRIDPSRSASLQYRLDSERVNISNSSGHLLLGKGPMEGVAKNLDGVTIMAVDAWWLINLICFGVVGLCGWSLVWCAGFASAITRWKELTPDFRTLSIAVGILIGAQFLDFLFNSFPSMFLLMLDAGLISVLQHYRPFRAPAFVPAQPPAFAVSGIAVP